MQILAHRGSWLCKEEQNKVPSFQRAFENGLGVETDLRDFNGELVVSHDLADEKCLTFKELTYLYQKIGNNQFLALNVKTDGIQGLLKYELEQADINRYFMFDMSVPEQVVYIREGFRTFSRQSEFEKEPVMYEQVMGIWMDEFRIPWITEKVVEMHLLSDKYVGIISPEIHKNPSEQLWQKLIPFKNDDRLILCTDEPMKAREFFT